MMSEEFAPDIPAYLNRINMSDEVDVSVRSLRAIHMHHTLSVPFENTDIHIQDSNSSSIKTNSHNRGISISPVDIQRKIVYEGRGGYCFEQSTLLYYVLRRMGFEVCRMGCRVRYQVPDGVDTGKLHMVLIVDLEGSRWLVDVAFGSMTPTYPLNMGSTEEVNSPYDPPRRLTFSGELGAHEAKLNGEWRTLYVWESRVFTLQDARVCNWFACTNEDCICTQVLMLARITTEARYTLLNSELNEWYHDGTNRKHRISTSGELLEKMKEYFCISLPPGTVIGNPPFPRV